MHTAHTRRTLMTPNEMEYDPNDITIEFVIVSEEERDRIRKAIGERGELSEMQMQVYQRW